MMNLAIDALAGGTVRLADGTELTILASRPIEPEYDYVRSDSAVLPDVRWIGADQNGHTHHWEPTGSHDPIGRPRYDIPSARRGTKRIPCDGSECGGVWGGRGYGVPAWFCTTCDTEVEPGYRPDDVARGPGIPRITSPGGTELTVDAAPALPVEDGVIRMPLTPSAGMKPMTVAPPADDPMPGRGFLDFYGADMVLGEPIKATVHFFQEAR